MVITLTISYFVSNTSLNITSDGDNITLSKDVLLTKYEIVRVITCIKAEFCESVSEDSFTDVVLKEVFYSDIKKH